jgi:predicted XRE-type DNA-binding protein
MSAFAKQIRPYVQTALAAAFEAERKGDQHLAFRQLERAHVLSQEATMEHLRVHGHMLRFALRHCLVREVLGQIPRLLLAAPLTQMGLIPTGNTGGSNVSGLRPMPVPADLQQIIDRARARAG